VNNLVSFRVTAPPYVALKKLKIAQIPIFKLKKSGENLYFSVNEEYYKKAFAIFAHPCYNTVVRRKSLKMRAVSFLKRRVALPFCIAAFIVFCAASNLAVLKIKVTGSGKYLSGQVLQIAAECGAREFSLCKNLDKPMLCAGVLALDGVTFCSVQRRGSFLFIDVQVEEGEQNSVSYQPLISPVEGRILKIVAICGTAKFKEGDEVYRGDVLIAAEEDAGEKIVPSLAVGYAVLCVTRTLTLAAEKESEAAEAEALKSPDLYAENVLERSIKVKRYSGGVIYEVTYSYAHTATINMQ